MSIQFDQAKDAKNTQKHGVSLAAAFEWMDAVTWPDQRQDYGEERIAGIGYIGDRLFYVVFVARGEREESSACERLTNAR